MFFHFYFNGASLLVLGKEINFFTEIPDPRISIYSYDEGERTEVDEDDVALSAMFQAF